MDKIIQFLFGDGLFLVYGLLAFVVGYSWKSARDARVEEKRALLQMNVTMAEQARNIAAYAKAQEEARGRAIEQIKARAVRRVAQATKKAAGVTDSNLLPTKETGNVQELTGVN